MSTREESKGECGQREDVIEKRGDSWRIILMKPFIKQILSMCSNVYVTWQLQKPLVIFGLGLPSYNTQMVVINAFDLVFFSNYSLQHRHYNVLTTYEHLRRLGQQNFEIDKVITNASSAQLEWLLKFCHANQTVCFILTLYQTILALFKSFYNFDLCHT